MDTIQPTEISSHLNLRIQAFPCLSPCILDFRRLSMCFSSPCCELHDFPHESSTSSSSSRHCEIRLSLTKLCGVDKTTLKLLSSVQCAPHSLGVNTSFPHRVLGIEAWLHREAAMMPPTAAQKRSAMGFAHRIPLRGHRCRRKILRKQT